MGGLLWGMVVALACGPAAAPAQTVTAEKPVAKTPAKKTALIAHVTLAGSIPDGVGQGGLLADVSPHLHRIVERLDKAATDPRVKGLVLSSQSPSLGRGRAEELRAAIGRIRKAGKPVAAHLVGAEPVHYMLASACDTVAMPPAATLEITGVRTEVTFFKAMLDKLGVDAEILQVGEFKGAGEPLTRTSMSPQLRAQYEQFVGDLYEQLVERIAADRTLPAEQVRTLIDTGVFTPEAAVEAKLIDMVAYEDEVISGLAGRLKIDQPKVARDYAQQKLDNDFSGIGGLVKLVELLSGQKQSAAVGKDRQIAIIYLTGEIKEGKGKDELLAGGSAGSDSVIKAIRDAAKDDKVVAIVLRIDSPGGSALASDLIWREAERTTKPVVASLSDTAASGGYYVAVAADRIVAAPGTLTGSIGVVGGKIAVGKALEKYGVHTDVVSKGRNAGWLSMQTPFTEQEREAFLATMKDVYRLFTSKVAAGRKLDMENLAKLAEGRVFTGRMAKELGLVDRLGTLDDAIDEAKKLAGIDDDEAVERVLLPEPRGLFDDLFGMSGEAAPVARLAAAAGAGGGAGLARDAVVRAVLLARMAGVPGLDGLVSEADALVQLSSGRPLMMLPMRVKVR
ncbi:MAG: signal peptide peptidase SppA [Planctomycetia bacterium]